MMFLTVAMALIATIGVLLWFTGWAESRVIGPEARTPEAKLH
jgi:hypothetical protein